MLRVILLFVLALSQLVFSEFVCAQARIPAELISYPEVILFNGKIAVFDGPLMNEKLLFHQAIAIRSGRVMAVGADKDLLKLKGPETQAIDLKGKMVLPGFVDPHTHPQEWAHYFRYDSFIPNVKLVYLAGPDDRFKELRSDVFLGWGPVLDDPPREMLMSLERRIKSAAAELGPGPDKWILALVSKQGRRFFGSVINKDWLDKIAPDNPVLVVTDWAPREAAVNSTAIEVVREMNPTPYISRLFDEVEKNGITYRAVPMRLYIALQSIAPKNFKEFKDCLKTVFLEYAKYGVTSIGNRVDYPTDISAFAELARTGKAAIRMGWSHHLLRRLLGSPAGSFFQLVGDFNNIGNELFWNMGAGSEGDSDVPFPQALCTTARIRDQYKQEYSPICGLDPRSQMREAVVNMVANRVRASQLHGSADLTYDQLMEAVWEGMKRGGLTMDEVRGLRISFDHLLLTRPDQIERIKEFGMVPSVTLWYIHHGEDLIKMFGPEIEEWMFLINSFVKGGIPVTINSDRLATDDMTYFWELEFLVRRNYNGRAYNAKEAVDRVTALKTITTWPARYLMREDLIGNLKPGYLADLMVIDKDYFAVPEDKIHTIKVLMTMLGGKITWVDRALERELAPGYERIMHPTFAELKGKIQGP